MRLRFLKDNIIFLWLVWHFLEAPIGIVKGWGNFLRFNLNYFSVPLLLKTLVSPWRRYKMNYGRGFNPGRYFEVFTFNMMSRTIGAVLRLFFIFLGLFFEALILIFGLGIIFFWFFLPLILLFIFFYGFRILF